MGEGVQSLAPGADSLEQPGMFNGNPNRLPQDFDEDQLIFAEHRRRLAKQTDDALYFAFGQKRDTQIALPFRPRDPQVQGDKQRNLPKVGGEDGLLGANDGFVVVAGQGRGGELSQNG